MKNGTFPPVQKQLTWHGQVLNAARRLADAAGEIATCADLDRTEELVREVGCWCDELDLLMLQRPTL